MQNKKRSDYRKRHLLFIDLETTGLDPEKHEIIEVGCLLVDGESFGIISEYYSKVKPEHIKTASAEGLEVAGYDKKLWKDAKNLKDVLRDLLLFAPDAIMAGWKVDFDWSFLSNALIKKNMENTFDYHILDIIPLVYLRFRKEKKPRGLGLRETADHLKIDIPKKHGAMTDIKATYEIFKELMQYFDQRLP